MLVNSKVYDIIITGVGAAGLQLAYELSTKSSMSNKNILLLDIQKKTANDRTWCFWTKENTPFDSVITNQWEQLEFLSNHFQHTFSLSPYKYKMLRSEDFYKYVWDRIDDANNIDFKEVHVKEITQTKEYAEVVTEHGIYKAYHVFDSRLNQGDFNKISEDYNLILQHFKGFLVDTKEPAFEVGKIRMFDFRIPQKNQVRFVYILPLSETKALIEFTVFSSSLLEDEEYDQALESYISNYLKIEKYQVLEEEKGVIPMTDFPFKRKINKNIYRIGTQGGMCKPSTGYAFLNMWNDAKRIADQLANQEPIELQSSQPNFRLYDAMLLDIMRRDGGSIASIFSDMFRKNKIQLIFKFLNEETSFTEDLKIMWSVPSLPFFKSMYNLAKK